MPRCEGIPWPPAVPCDEEEKEGEIMAPPLTDPSSSYLFFCSRWSPHAVCVDYNPLREREREREGGREGGRKRGRERGEGVGRE